MLFEYPGIALRLYLDMSVGIGGDKWPAAELFCNFITDPSQYDFFRSQFAARRCVELGSGNGLVGIVIESLFSPLAMLITDIEDHVNHIQKNIETNGLKISKAVELDWRKDNVLPADEKFDIILALEWFGP